MKSAVMSLLLAVPLMNGQTGVSQPPPAPAAQQWKIDRNLKDSDGCIYLADEGNLYETLWGNTCPRAMQFTIHWAGKSLPRDTTYRTNARPDIRHITRRDVNATLISEGPATMGLGPHSDAVRIEKKALHLGQTLLWVVNDDEHPAFVGGYISIRKDGKEVRKCELGILIPGAAHADACVYFPGEDYVSFMEAERDPN